MKAIEEIVNENDNPKRRRSVSTAELFTALEALLPFARNEIEWLDEYVSTMPDDPDHEQDELQAKRGIAALALAGQLIARKSDNISRKQQTLKEAMTDV